MPRSALSLLSAVALAATVSVAPVVATPDDGSQSTPTAEAPSTVTVQRLAGVDRYGTATAVSDQWSTTGGRACIVSGHNFPDALVAASRAGIFDAPVLLAKADHLPSETGVALARLQPERIVVLGGTGSVSDAVLADLAQYAGSEGVERVTGSNRYDTSAHVAAQYTAGRDRVFLASGEDYPDALSAAAVAGAEHEPLLLTKAGQLPSEVAEQLERLAPDEVVVVGGPGAISNPVANEAASYSTSGVAHRVAGEDRYKTSAAVAQEFSPDLTPGYVTSGVNYADALVVSALAARDGVPVILTPADRVADGTHEALSHVRPEHVFVAGGPAAVSDGVVEVLRGSDEVRRLTNGCAYDMRGVPECGAYLGAAHGGNTDPSDWEEDMNHPLGVRRTYWNFDKVNAAVNTAEGDLAKQRLPWISFKLPYSWTDVADGRGDAQVKDLATRLSQLDGPVWVAFHHEPEGDGDIQEWKRMQEHLAPLVRDIAPNVGYTVILTGWNQLYGPEEFHLSEIWPDTTVDVAGFDVYQLYGQVKDGKVNLTITDLNETYFEPLGEWAQQEGVAWGLGETGYSDIAPEIWPDWPAEKYQEVVDNGGVVFSYFDSDLNSTASWDLGDTPAKVEAFSDAIQDTPNLPTKSK